MNFSEDPLKVALNIYETLQYNVKKNDWSFS